MDPYVSDVLVGIETRAWAEDRARRTQEDSEEVDAVVEAEWAGVTMVDRFLAARGNHIEVICIDGAILRGVCTEVGCDWLTIRGDSHDAVHVSQIARVVGAPFALHHDDVRRVTWTSFLRTLVGRWIRVQVPYGCAQGRLRSVARDHITFDDGSLIALQAMFSVRLPG